MPLFEDCSVHTRRQIYLYILWSRVCPLQADALSQVNCCKKQELNLFFALDVCNPSFCGSGCPRLQGLGLPVGSAVCVRVTTEREKASARRRERSSFCGKSYLEKTRFPERLHSSCSLKSLSSCTGLDQHHFWSGAGRGQALSALSPSPHAGYQTQFRATRRPST